MSTLQSIMPSEVAGDASPALPPLWAGRYHVLREIGRGGQGTVYLAHDVQSDQKVALKVLSRRVVADEVCRARFEREAHVTARIQHPGICTVYDFGIVGDIPYIAMRYVEGETLATRIRRAIDGDDTVKLTPSPVSPVSPDTPQRLLDPGTFHESNDSTWTARRRQSAEASSPPSVPASRLAIDETLAVIESAARVLHAAHDAGFVHRDIKPGNILVSTDGQVFILDFGLASNRHEEAATLTMTGELFGTPAYMSPEQVRGEASRLDRRSDVWSLGVTLYELLALARPFSAPTREGLVNAIQVSEVPNPRRHNPAVPQDLVVVLETALEKDTWRRYQSALDFAEEIRRVRAGEPILARPPGPLVRARRWAARNPVLAVAMSMIFLCLTLSLHVTTWLLSGAELKALEANSARSFAEADQRRTESTLRRSYGVLDRLLTQADAAAAVSMPLDEVAQATLDASATLYREVIREHGGNPALQDDVAAAHLRLARVHLIAGQPQLAVTHGRSAISSCQYALRLAPTKTELNRLLADSYEVLARSYLGVGSRDRAEDTFRRGRQLAEALANDNPHDKDDRQRLETISRELALVGPARTPR